MGVHMCAINLRRRRWGCRFGRLFGGRCPKRLVAVRSRFYEVGKRGVINGGRRVRHTH